MMKKILRLAGKLAAIAAAVYGVLFAVFYFDLDGKFLYHVWIPFVNRRYEKLERKDVTKTPYGMTVEKAE